MNSFVIRLATEPDMSSVFELAREFATSFAVEKHFFHKSFSAVLSSADAELFVAECEGKIEGYCLAFDHPAFFANGRVTWVEEIMVVESCRLSGVGKLLMSEVERWARHRESKMVALATRRASSFYTAVGYEDSATYFRKLLS